MPKPGEHLPLHSQGKLGAGSALFVGVSPLREFRYAEIREFARRALTSLAQLAQIQRVAITLHGTGYGLDESEAFESEVAGLVDAIAAGELPPALETVAFVERSAERANRLRVLLEGLLPRGRVPAGVRPRTGDAPTRGETRLRDAGLTAAAQPLVFVAMPFAESMGDVFRYGIFTPVKEAGCVCERADRAVFTGDIMDWVKERIDAATLVIADLTGANANVYLEIGYAWGRGRPTLLLVTEAEKDKLGFDVRNERCLVYKTIETLEELLRKELPRLLAQG